MSTDAISGALAVAALEIAKTCHPRSGVHGHFPSIEDLAARPDWPEVRAELRRGLRGWYDNVQWVRQVMHGG